MSKLMYYMNVLTEPIDKNRKPKLMGYLNQAYIIFNDNLKVLNQLDAVKENSSNDKVIKLIKYMCDDLKIDYSNLNDSFIEKPFR